jgi:MFS family permease
VPATDHALSLPPTFNRLAWSNLAAQSAEQIALAAAPIVAVLLLGVGEGRTGLLQTALTLPFILFAIPAGLLADRISRRWLMAGAEALRAAALSGILLLIWLGLLTLPCSLCSASSRYAARSPIAWRRPHWCRRWYRRNFCPRRTRGSNWRAPLRLPAARRWAACWWDG